MVPQMDDASYRKIQDQFYSNLNGTSPLEIGLVLSAAPVCVLLRSILLPWLFGSAVRFGLWTNHLLDFGLLIFPIILCCTVWSEYLQAVIVSMIFMILALLTTNLGTGTKAQTSKQSVSTLSESLQLTVEGKRPFISNFRAYGLIGTAISILAVDFVIFPRRFAKTETYGTGFMDYGVGGFIICNAVVSLEARGKNKQNRGFSASIANILQAIKSTAPLLILGFGRLVSVKAADYHEHISEYGVHWNFFFTLAAVRVLSALVLTFFSPRMSWIISLAVAVGYQYCLTNLGLEHFVLHGSDGNNTREGLLNANREGVFSSFGYLALYFAGVQLGIFLFKKRSTLQDWCRVCVVLLISDVSLWVIFSLCTETIQPVSRRTANLSFIIWSFAYSVHLLATFLLTDLITTFSMVMGFIPAPSSDVKGQKPNTVKGHTKNAPTIPESKFCLLAAINRNQLLYFLLANILTGVVNMTMQTILQPPNIGLVAVSCYMYVLGFFLVILHAMNITTKVW
ncbi:phosphatidylinositol-glycan biosynthesis class W protein-like [Ptychodera flava]|uniref:phosphatidylinositol-glycan biosynthesis class W protein-like n=1 Tax=Ptychodera flava TaxID=63121 RepID=UPI00396A8AB7